MIIPYKKYNVEQVKNSDDKDKQVIYIEYEIRGLKCLLAYFPAYFKFVDSQTDHLNFYALTDGWNAITDTGYHSFFLTVEKDFKVTQAEVIKYFEGLFQQMNFDVQAPIQASLF